MVGRHLPISEYGPVRTDQTHEEVVESPTDHPLLASLFRGHVKILAGGQEESSRWDREVAPHVVNEKGRWFLCIDVGSFNAGVVRPDALLPGKFASRPPRLGRSPIWRSPLPRPGSTYAVFRASLSPT